MSSTPNITPAEALASLRAEIRQRTQLVRLITSLQGKEYRNCGNGYYYLLINDDFMIGYDID